MPRDNNGIFNRYVDTTSPVTWPRSRRTAYKSIINTMVSSRNIDKVSLFRKWTIEGSDSCYEEINRALLNDDLQTLQKHANYINELRQAIKENLSYESIKVYRGLKLESNEMNQLKVGMAFLWPTFSSTSRNKNIAQVFGSYMFEIDGSPNDGTYRTDIRNYSAYPEEEVLFYPYSGFCEKNTFKDARVIQLQCMDTMIVEKFANSSNSSGQSSVFNMTTANNKTYSLAQHPFCPHYNNAALDADYHAAADLAVNYGGDIAHLQSRRDDFINYATGCINTDSLCTGIYLAIDRMNNGYFDYFANGHIEENHYDDEIKDSTIVLKHQKYSTWLYTFLLIISSYVLFYTTLIKPQSRTIIHSNITRHIFDELYLKHKETLSCRCSTIIIPYQDFVLDTVIFHPVCSSEFVKQQWINALYFINASTYHINDFRTTAKSQFELLTSFCSFSQDAIVQNQIDLRNNELVTIYLLTDIQVQSEIDAKGELFINNLSTRIISFLNYLKLTTQTNHLITALNTNFQITIESNPFSENILIRCEQVRFMSKFDFKNISNVMSCGVNNPTSPVSFLNSSNDNIFDVFFGRDEYNSGTKQVNGFFSGCTPLEALLRSSLDCLYNIKCLELLLNYFPNLNSIHLDLNNSVLTSLVENHSVNDHFRDLFVKERSITINYSKYFDHCSPSLCTYTTTDRTDISSAITLFISLYGGLVIILRFMVPSLIHSVMNFKYNSRNISLS
ncbi:hypothetical protein I4U23_027421 [Adineta vaga]|nr:hypothetical protein I4U23_027421 [Adineta vaga]